MLQTLRGEGPSRDQIVWVMVEQMGKQAAGEKQGRKPWTLRELGGKTLWDWLQLLIVPVALSLITVAFAWQQDARQQRIEDQRAEAERELAVQRAQDEALQTYIDQMGAFSLRGISVSQ
jgi:cytochrome c-type biogenesis protein CcmH/NrfF